MLVSGAEGPVEGPSSGHSHILLSVLSDVCLRDIVPEHGVRGHLQREDGKLTDEQLGQCESALVCSLDSRLPA
jgi:hypothetical protein